MGDAEPRPGLAECLAAVAPDLPGALVDDTARRRMTAVAERIPGAMATFGFECRLAEDDTEVDLGLAVTPENGGSELLAALDAPASGRPWAAGDRSWPRIHAFVRDWLDAASPLGDWVPFLFMEFDVPTDPDPVPVPSVFLALDAPLRGDEPEAIDVGYPPLAALRRACALLAGEALAPEVDRMVLEAYRSLPANAWVMHAGVLLGRAATGVRLSIAAHGEAMPSYLAALGGDAAAAQAAALIDALGDSVPWSQLDFDLAPAVLPRIGFGLQPSAPDGWSALLEGVERRGWCTPEKRRALLGWSGRTPTSLAHGPCVLERHLSHVKLVCAPGRPTSAKAYLGVVPRRPPAPGAGPDLP
jgi:hypothetical protein